ncbi:MAG: beta-agarase [Lentimonas sp.]
MRFAFIASLLLFGFVTAQAQQLVSLTKESLHPKISFSDTKIVSSSADGILVDSAGKEEWPNVGFQALDKPWDLSDFYTVKVDVTNLGSAPLFVGLRLDSKRGGESETPQHAQGFDMLEPAETRTITVRLVAEDWIFEKPLPLVGMRRAPGVALMDVSRIDSIQVFAGHVKSPITFRISNLRAEGKLQKVPTEGFLPFVDAYGQYKHADWPGKIYSDDDLKAVHQAELKDLAKHPGVSGLGQYGGWQDGPQQEASGYFRVEKIEGKWWFVDPEGYLFWSTGPTCMDSNFGYTGVQDREAYFEGLPKEGDPLAQFYGRSSWAPHGFYADKLPFKMFKTYKANLYRKFGKGWKAQFDDLAHRRLKSWGMNTVANWAVPSLYKQQRTPYVANFFIEGNRTLEGSKGYWGKFHDVFDPSFREVIQKNLKRRQLEARDPWCLGFFVDNELAWGNDDMSLALDTLSSPAEQPAKQVFVEDLKWKYGEIAKLNLAWGTQYVSWRALLDARTKPNAMRASGDLQKFYKKIADTYFSTVKEELKKAAPNHLYLGCRFAWVNDTVAISAAQFCDVVSYNKYEHSIRSLHLPYHIDRPMMIGEYHFGSTDRGHFHPGLRQADDQAQRAEKFKDYMTSALDNPQMIGVHWFQYVDEHIAGRADGENYNVGLVDICDTPYPEMVDAIREVAGKMYTSRIKGKAMKAKSSEKLARNRSGQSSASQKIALNTFIQPPL